MSGKISTTNKVHSQLLNIQTQMNVTANVFNTLLQGTTPTKVELDDVKRLNKLICKYIALVKELITIAINNSLRLEVALGIDDLNRTCDFYIRHVNTYTRGTNITADDSNQLGEVNSQLHCDLQSLFEILRKLKLNAPNKGLAQLSKHLCWVCGDLAELKRPNANAETSIYYATQAIEWSKHLTQECFNEVTLRKPNYKEPTKYNLERYKKNTKQQMYDILFRQALDRKALKQARWFFDRLLKHQTKVDDHTIYAISELIDSLIEAKQFRHAYRYIGAAKQYLEFEPISVFTAFYSAKYTTWYKLLENKIQESYQGHFQEIVGQIYNHQFTHVSMTYHAPSCEYVLIANEDHKITDDVIENLKALAPDIERIAENEIRIRNVISLRAESFVKLCLQLETALKSPQPTTLPITEENLVDQFKALLTQKREPDANNANLEQQQQKHEASTTVAAKEKIKTRGKPYPKAAQSSSNKQNKPSKVITTHELGFKLKAAKRNITEIKGKTTPCRTYYVYWDKIENPSAKCNADILHYKRDIFARGKVVSAGKQGYRPVFSNESGLDHMTFKLRDPSKDLGLLLIKDDEVVDKNGQKRTLFRVGRAVYH